MTGREMQMVMTGVQLGWRRSWQQTQILAYFIANKDVKRGKQIPLGKIFTIPGDKKPSKTRPPTPEETKALIKRWSKFKERKN